jgi:hypothetical protein
MTSEYRFRTVWRVAGTRREVLEALADSEGLARWWPAVYLAGRRIAEGSDDGVGRATELYTKGWLPYTLRWNFVVTEPVTEDGFALRAQGDLNGEGRWSFRQDGPEVEIVYDWAVSAAKPMLRYLSWLLKPLFSANHRWAMARGEESLKLELRRRRATLPDELGSIPAPPGPTFRMFAGRSGGPGGKRTA